MVRFGTDGLDQSEELIPALNRRSDDATVFQQLPGDHLTPASAGLRRSLLGAWADDPKRAAVIGRLTTTIAAWTMAD